MRLFKIVIFCLKWGFLSVYLPIFFSRTIRNLVLIPWVKRYIRIFDVISELYSVLPRRRQRFEQRSHLGQHAISEVWVVTPRNKVDFQKTQRVPLLQFQKVWAFWALDMAPTLDVPVLFRLIIVSFLQCVFNIPLIRVFSYTYLYSKYFRFLIC